ncbi:hypothetical protein QBC46DRAFT_396221 [Diplogelasinospora grovesii]|uniref:HNH nuclease domain-containing protein n=1 Tax=Diplogelasinospora grovesii TaxID=303347 RepID=A0AAN6MYN2_9PEZI|nr:hypothetical protein QBC46DRAFT_396221 [Diplogelasinospora grovesii]
MAAPSHRHQSSLEGLIDFSAAEPLFANEQQRTQAVGRFRRIVDYFEAAEQPASRYGDGYNRPALVRLTFEYARSQKSQDRFLGAFFRSLALGMLDDDSVNLSDDSVVADFRSPLFGFAEFLMANFFLPLRASTNKTPQPSPVYHAAVQQAQTQEDQQRIQDFVGTPERLSTLRGSCLTRDRHRCVITHTFDITEAMERLRRPPATDDDGNPLDMSNNGGLEVAHILPHALTKEENGELNESRKAAIAILNMFDSGVMHMIEGTDMHRPYNALTLSLEMHQRFGQFHIFFERIEDADAPPHTYRINSFIPFSNRFPVTRTLFMHPSIDPPSERLLALHFAIGHILHLSGAGDYIQVILRDMEDGVVREDGSTQLGDLLSIALQMRG